MKKNMWSMLLLCIVAELLIAVIFLRLDKKHAETLDRSTDYRYRYIYDVGLTMDIYDRHGVFIHQLRYDMPGLGTGDDFGPKAYYDENDNLILYISPYSTEGVSLYSFKYDENNRILSMLEKILWGMDFKECYCCSKTWSYRDDGYSVSTYDTRFNANGSEIESEYLRSYIDVQYVDNEAVVKETRYDSGGNVTYTSFDSFNSKYFADNKK